MTKSSKRFRRSKAFTLPLAPIAGLMAMPTVRAVIYDITHGNISNVSADLGGLVGMDTSGSFHADWLLSNIIPPVVGLLVHKFVGGKLGLNRMLASAGVPMIRI